MYDTNRCFVFYLTGRRVAKQCIVCEGRKRERNNDTLLLQPPTAAAPSPPPRLMNHRRDPAAQQVFDVNCFPKPLSGPDPFLQPLSLRYLGCHAAKILKGASPHVHLLPVYHCNLLGGFVLRPSATAWVSSTTWSIRTFTFV